MYGDKKPFETTGPIENGKNYDQQKERLDAYLVNAVEKSIKSKGRKATPEMVLHQVSTICAVAKVKNNEDSPYDIIGGESVINQVCADYALEMSNCRIFQRLAKNPGNQDEINKLINRAEGIPDDGMTIQRAMQDMKNRINTVSASMSWK